MAFTAGVLVAHPGTQHSYELAFALHRARLLERYVTGFYYKEDTAWGRAMRISSRAIPPAARRRLLGRRKMGLPSHRVIVRPSAELLYAGSCRLPWLRRYASRVLEWRNDHFDEFAGRIVRQIEPAAVICYNSCALKTFQQTQSFADHLAGVGVTTALDFGVHKFLEVRRQSHSHKISVERIGALSI